MTLYEYDSEHIDLLKFDKLANFMLNNKNKIIPNTYTDKEFDHFIYSKFY
jgi:hypothetical protein